MAEAINEFRAFVSTKLNSKLESELSDEENESLKQEKVTFLKERIEDLRKEDKKLGLEMSKVKFAIVIGQSWFVEFPSEEDSTLDMDYFNIKATVSAEIKDIEVKI